MDLESGKLASCDQSDKGRNVSNEVVGVSRIIEEVDGRLGVKRRQHRQSVLPALELGPPEYHSPRLARSLRLCSENCGRRAQLNCVLSVASRSLRAAARHSDQDGRRPVSALGRDSPRTAA